MMYYENRSLMPSEMVDIFLLNAISEGLLVDFFETDQIPDFSFVFVTADEIQALNSGFRKVDSVTDVLSFPAQGEIDPETGREYLGDIIVCAEKAQEQAERSNHVFMAEASLLLIHALLHLLGYDHELLADQEEMWRLQSAYLTHFSINIGRKPGEDFDF